MATSSSPSPSTIPSSASAFSSTIHFTPPRVADGDGATGAPSPSTRQQVLFPPYALSDFVIHYRTTDYYVHTFVLHYHSQYFRAYFAALTPPTAEAVEEQKGDEGKKRLKLAVLLPDARSLLQHEDHGERCSAHSPLVHCILLPDQFGIKPVAEHDVGEDDMELFLQHLYFAATLHMPPFEPSAEVLASIQSITVPSLVFPSGKASICATDAYAAERAEQAAHGGLSAHAALLSLFHYFDCHQALQRCEEVILGDLVEPTDAWFWLPLCALYGLRAAEARCIELAADDEGVKLSEDGYANTVVELLVRAPSAAARVLVAMSANLASARADLSNQWARRGRGKWGGRVMMVLIDWRLLDGISVLDSDE